MKNPTMIMISLPVTNLSKSVDFYKALGFTHNDHFPSDRAAHMVLSETISLMLITHTMWQEFTTREIPDAKKTAQVGFILSREDKQAVDETIHSGTNAGGTPDVNPVEDFEGMYGRSIEDPDGHIWEAKWMDNCFA